MSWTVKTSAYSHRNSRLAVDIKVSSQSISDNSTLLSYRVYADNDGYSTSYVAYYSRSVTINGTTVYSASNRINGYKNQTLKSGTIRIPHNSDGTKSINVSLSADIYSSSGNQKTGSQSITLPTINRGIYDVSLATGWTDLDGPKTITFEKYNSNTTVKVRWQYWSNASSSKRGEYIVRDTDGNSLADDYISGTAFKFQDEFIKAMHDDKPNYKTASVYITIRAYIGDNLIQTITRKVDLKLKVEAPRLTVNYKFTGKNQSIIGADSKGLRDVHKLELSFDGTAYNGAKIDEYKIEYDGSTYRTKNNTFSIVPKIAGSRELKVTVFDSRGFLRIVTLNVEVLPYEKPKINYSAHRAENGQENPIGDIAQVKGSISIFDVLGKNSAWWKISVNNQTVNSSGISYSFSLPIHEQREITISYGDKFTTAEVKAIIPVGYAPLVLGKESVGVNVVPPENGRGLYIQDGLINGEKILDKSDLSSLDINTFTIPDTYVSPSYSDRFEDEYVLEQIYKKAPNGLSLHTYTQRSQGFVILYKYDNDTNAQALFVRYGYLPGGYMRKGYNNWVKNVSNI